VRHVARGEQDSEPRRTDEQGVEDVLLGVEARLSSRRIIERECYAVNVYQRSGTQVRDDLRKEEGNVSLRTNDVARVDEEQQWLDMWRR